MWHRKLCIWGLCLIMFALSPPSTLAGKPKKGETDDVPPAPTVTLDMRLDDLARQVVESLELKSKTKIAVVEFSDLNGNVNELGQFIAEELITRLYRSGNFEVVERHLLNKVMKEHELSVSGLIDGSSAQQLGRILGVDAIASGSMTDLNTSIKLNARLISTETGTIFAVAAVEIAKDENTTRLLARRVLPSSADAKPGDAVSPPADGPVASAADLAADAPPPGKPGLVGEYYNLVPGNLSLPAADPVFQRIDPTFDFDWGWENPVPRINPDWFGVRWTGLILVEKPGTYTLSITHDDGLRIWIDGKLIHDHWASGYFQCPADVKLSRTGWLPFRAEYYELGSTAQCHFRWAPPGSPSFEALLASRFRHVE